MASVNDIEEFDDEDITVELDLENGEKVNCGIITILTVNDKDYIALMPMLPEDDERYGEVWFYGYKENMDDPNEEPELIYIDDDEEYDAVNDAFDEFLDSQEYDELIEEEEEN